ncbi:MAG: hypothetical protein ACXVEE_22305 [Polyangiales bacterium]
MSERHEPIPLSKPASVRDEWFDGEPRYSVPPETAKPQPVILASKARTVLAGIVVGAAAGTVAISVARVVARRDITQAIARALSGGNLRDVPSAGWAFGVAALTGAVLALVVALVTRHVRRAIPIAIFGAIFAPVLWLGVHVLALRHHAWLVTEALPIGPMIVGSAIYGALLSLIVPIRGH